MSKFNVTIGNQTYEVELNPSELNRGIFTVTVDGQPVEVQLPNKPAEDGMMSWLMIDKQSQELIFDREFAWVQDYRGVHQLSVEDQAAPVARPPSGDGRVKAPIPGLISRLLVEPGGYVENGQPVVVLEAMKMENEIRAQRDGVVSAILVELQQTVIRGEILLEISDPALDG